MYLLYFLYTLYISLILHSAELWSVLLSIHIYVVITSDNIYLYNILYKYGVHLIYLYVCARARDI